MLAHDAAGVARANQLLEELGFFTDQWRDEDYAYEKENSLPSPAVVAKHGTDCSRSGMFDLRDILGNTDSTSLTFEEIAMDLATCPEWQLYQLPYLQKQILYQVSRTDYGFYCDRYSENPCKNDEARLERIKEGMKRLGTLLPLSVAEWMGELKEILKWREVISVETWT